MGQENCGILSKFDASNEEGPRMQKWHMERRPEIAATHQNRNKGPRHKTVTASQDQEDIRWDRREDLQTGEREANTWIFCVITENEELNVVERSAPSETKNEIVHGVRARCVGLQ
jgi:hypothetical protein